MKIVSVAEDKKIEKRISITPEIAKKYISNGFEVSLPKNYGDHVGFIDEDYKSQGVDIIEDEKKLIQSSDIIIQLGLPSEDKLSHLKENQILIGTLNPFVNKEKLDILLKKNHDIYKLRRLGN